MSHFKNLPKLENFEVYRPSAAALRVAARRKVVLPETLTSKQIIVSWICAVVGSSIMVETLFFKFSGSTESRYIFQKMGADPWMRCAQGVWELLSSICLSAPRLRWMGGILTAGATDAAILSHLTWLGFSVLGDHGLLFCMALTTFGCGFIILLMHRHQIPFPEPPTTWIG